jgi:pyruvate dehydrogenase E2 component (dihydrolipoamide acetyltransferase)
MPHIVLMPRPGNTVESCVIVEWRATEGTEVKADDPICDVETDKAVFEVTAGADGILLKILYPSGEDVPVLTPIAVVGAAGEDPVAALSPYSQAPRAAQTAESDASAGKPPAAASSPEGTASRASGPAISPRARGTASQAALDPSGITGTGPEGRIIEADVLRAISARPALSAAAKAALASGAQSPRGDGSGLPLGSGIGGRLRLADLGARTQEFPGSYSDAPMKGMRKIISERMLESLSTTAQFTLSAAADASQLLDFRQRLKAGPERLGLRDVTINDLVLFALSRVLPDFPCMNAHKAGDSIRSFGRVHLGNAVDTERGLMVPVIRFADGLDLRGISREAKRLAAACREGRAKPEELSGSTFTVTNLGSLGVESFTPVLNAPEVAILGVCALKQEAESDGSGGIRLAPRLGLSLTINHQAVDGAPAARFLKALREAIACVDLLALESANPLGD